MYSTDEDQFFEYTRMNIRQFDYLFSLVGPMLQKKSLREPLPPKFRLAVTLTLVYYQYYYHFNQYPVLYSYLSIISYIIAIWPLVIVQSTYLSTIGLVLQPYIKSYRRPVKVFGKLCPHYTLHHLQ